MKQCPFCAEDIKEAAIKCRYCHSDLTDREAEDPVGPWSGHHPHTLGDNIADPRQPGFSMSRGARAKVRELLANEQRDELRLRLAIPADFNGTNYQFFFDERTLRGDMLFDFGDGVRMVIDGDSFPLVASQHLDFQTWPAEGFTIGSPANEPISGANTPAPGSDNRGTDTPPPPRGSWPYKDVAFALSDWKGRTFMTKEQRVPAYCQACGRSWDLDAATANTLAQEQGLAGRLARGGTRMEQFGATFSPGSSGRRIAAGNESARQQNELAMLYMLCSCPACRSADVLLARR